MHDVLHRPPEERDLAAEPLRMVDGLLDARHVGCERRDHDAPFGAREDRRKRFADDTLREGVSRPLRVGGIREHAQHALVPNARDAREVGRLAVDRRLVELEVAGVEDRTDRRAQRQRTSARHRVIDVHELDVDRTERQTVARLDLHEVRFAHLVLARFGFDQRDRHRRSGDRRARELAQKIRDAADMIFVPVRHHDAAQLVRALANVGEIVDDHVDAEHLFVGEHQAAVDHDQIVVRLDDRHVAADFAAPAEGDDANVGLLGRSRDH